MWISSTEARLRGAGSCDCPRRRPCAMLRGMSRPESTPRSTSRAKATKVVAFIAGLGLWYFAVLPYLFAHWSPPECGNPCAGPSSWPATIIVVGALAPLALLFTLTAHPRRVAVFGVVAAVVSALSIVIAWSFENRVCPSFNANDCRGRGAVAFLYWMAYLGPVFVASFILGPIATRSWSSHFALALALAGAIGLGIAAAPSTIGDAHVDRDTLFFISIGWPFVIGPLVIVAFLGSLARTGISRAQKSPDAAGAGSASPASTA